MQKSLLCVIGLFGLLAASSGPLSAQPAPTPADLTLHPGDTITWTPTSTHGVQFGGRTDVTTFTAIQGLLTLDPPPTANAQGAAQAGLGKTLKATVKSDAVAGSTFNFTCQAHPSDMVTVQFKIEAGAGGQSHDITTPGATKKWILKTATGDKNLNKP